MSRQLITYRAASGIKGHIIVPIAYSDKAIEFLTDNLKATVIETRAPHATQGLILPKGWALLDEVQRYWNSVELVNNHIYG